MFAGPNNIAYSATKADQAHQVRLLAAELGPHGVRVNGINPDGVVRGSGHLRRRLGRLPGRGLRGQGGGARRLLRQAHPARPGGAARAHRRRRLRADRRRPLADHRAAHPGRLRRRRRVPPVTGSLVAGRGRPRRVQRPGDARPGRRRPAGAARGRTGSATARSGCPTASTGTSSGSTRTSWSGCGPRPGPRQRGERLAGVAVDSWAVDYGLLDARGALLGNPRHYRDPRTEPVIADVHRRVDPEELYRRQRAAAPAVQHALPARRRADPGRRARALLIPDLLGYWLTGAQRGRGDQRLHHRPARRPHRRLGPHA